eukprot:CAMPEP_0119318002 /NCGR_PEP_ID=MMETSP1333-20130426/45247_1 /TAXON_ID=418940 /ORGANISM="Scyphosphaera apsteinii, Strain RCC1455" /LENGTH=81 /DNA_ID=CAMNT_0007324091 /DNA_START=21 /DNA_END=262 /DNA_ORIENTATION=-
MIGDTKIDSSAMAAIVLTDITMSAGHMKSASAVRVLRIAANPSHSPGTVETCFRLIVRIRLTARGIWKGAEDGMTIETGNR